MGSLNTALSVANSALALDQALIGVTGQNIANLDNPDYARRQAIVEEMPPLQLGSFTVGSGVKLQQITSVRDAVLNLRIASEQGDVARHSGFVEAMNQVEQLFPADGSSGISAALDKFWASWQGLAVDPTSAGASAQVFSSSQSVVSAFRTASKALSNASTSTAQKLSDDVAQANEVLRQIAACNANASADTPELRDRQDQLLGQLSKLMSVAVLRNGAGLQITTEGGSLLVSGTTAKTLQLGVFAANSHAISVDGNDVSGEISGGSLRGELDAVGSSIPNLQNRLDTLASGVASAVNAAHPTAFFLGNTASTLQLALADSSKVQAGSSGLPGDNSVARSIADLRSAGVVNGQTATDYHAQTVFDLGEQISDAAAQRDASQKLLDSMNQQRQQVEGVSIDQEAANLMQYQRAYSAAARILTAVDQMLQTALSIGASTTA